MKLQDQMRQTLENAGIPYKEVKCYGHQIVITSHCLETAKKWSSLLDTFATVRGVIRSYDECAKNSNTVLRPSKVEVFRTFARI